ncbi:MAG: hypothetical protein ACLP8Y_02805 [Thermoplasmata archaeon]
MPQQRIWNDPRRPKLTDFPEAIREQIVRRLAKMAARCIRRKIEATSPRDPTRDIDHE